MIYPPHPLPSPLPRFDRALMRTLERVVPEAERPEWSRSWQAELWHRHNARQRRKESLKATADLAMGLGMDAIWLRTESWRCAYDGTAALCLAALVSLCVLALVIALATAGGWQVLRTDLRGPFIRFLIATPLVVFVTYATASRRHAEPTSQGKLRWIRREVRRQLFFTSKSLLVLLLAFLLSVDGTLSLHTYVPNTAEILQVLFYVILALVGLRWAFHDQEGRCKECLRELASPARVGRPSHNLLEWNGTEQACRDGHGLLSIPEIETSWCQSSRWIEQEWDQAAST
jgi:hypothetical protein